MGAKKKRDKVAPVNKAFDHAHRIRKFERELYWHRTFFFSASILALFAGWRELTTTEPDIPLESMIYGVTLLGLFASCAWFFIDQASSSRDKIWRRHIGHLKVDNTDRNRNPILKFLIALFSVNNFIKFIIVAVALFWFNASLQGAEDLASSIIDLLAPPCEKVCAVDSSLLSKLKSLSTELAGATPAREKFCLVCDRKEELRRLLGAAPPFIAAFTIILGYWLCRTPNEIFSTFVCFLFSKINFRRFSKHNSKNVARFKAFFAAYSKE
jgi:hypothetical protein